ncbi:MAG: nitroreductase family protein [Armatimonadota bacterium]
MELLEAIYVRRSVRAYSDEAVSRATLDKLMLAAVQAPTGMNMQPWAFGVIQGIDLLKSYSERTKTYLLENMQQFPMLERYRDFFADPESDLFHGAPALIAIFAKPGCATPDFDCAMAAQNLMLSACDMGLGTCWIGFFGFLLNQPEVKRELGVREDYRAIAPIIVGYPLQTPPPVEKNPPLVVFWLE